MDPWTVLAARQAGAISWRQLTELEVSRGVVRNKLASGRWARRTEAVLTVTTGPLSEEQRRWVAVLHCGPDVVLGGLTALSLHGLQRWERPEVCVLVPNADSFEPVDGIQVVRTRRSLTLLAGGGELPCCRIEPAALLWAAHEPHPRSAAGLLAAVVQQRLTTPDRLLAWIDTLRPLRRAATFRELLHDLGGGSQSLAEIDVLRMCRTWGLVAPRRQKRRRDRSGRVRFTDCEWDLPDGRVLVLEIDGAFHLDAEQYTEDVRRHRGLTTERRIVIRCTAREARHEQDGLVRDLLGLGVPRAA